MKTSVFFNPLKACLQISLLLALVCLSFSAGSVNTVHASALADTSSCGQQLADAKAKFLALLPTDGSIPATPEVKAAAQDYIRLSNLCYDEIQATTSLATLQANTSTFIDNGGIVPGDGLSAEFVLTGTKWGLNGDGTTGGTVTYSFMGDGIGIVNSYENSGSSVAIKSLPGYQSCFITDIKNAFTAWQAVSNIKFKEVPDSGVPFNTPGATGDIRIGAHAFDGPSGTLAHAYFPPPSGYTGSDAGDIHFDSAENWTCDTSGIDIGIVALHEIGHSLGLNHQDPSTTAVMNPVYSVHMTSLQTDDIAGITSVYGPAAISAPPGNDNFGSATVINTNPYNPTVLDTTGATTEANEPGVSVSCDPSQQYNDHTLYLGHNSVWYRYTPSSNGSVYMDTLNSDYDTYIAVWTGTSLTNLSLVACGDDTLAGQPSELVFDAAASTTYYIQIAQFNGYYLNGTRTIATGGNLQFQLYDVAEVGKYNDTDHHWSYIGKWGNYSGSGPYLNTLHYTGVVGNWAWFPFKGTQFVFSYTQASNRGSFEVYVDGNKIATVNANSATTQWQKTFTSPIFLSGTHVAQFRNIGGAGPVFDVDAIDVRNTAAPGAGTYDDSYFNWRYIGKWASFTGSGPFNNTLRYTATIGDTAAFTFTGTQFILSYTQATNRGSFEVYVDGNKVTTLNANGITQWQKVYISPVYSSGAHEVQLKNIGGSGKVIDVDAIQVFTAPIPGSGPAYDDNNVNWSYSGKWSTFSGSGPANNTLHYTAVVGNTASFPFTGTQFTLSYTQNTNRGSFEVYVDGTKIATINANGALQWQKTFTSPIFATGTHVVQLKDIGGSATVMDVDAIQILNTPLPGSGPYEDSDNHWFYSGKWSTFSGSGPSGSNLHYTSAVGNWAWFPFDGTQFILKYTQNTNRGSFEVYVDGNKIVTINANGALQWQKTFTSPVFATGTHVVQLKNIGGSGSITDVDAIQILNTQTVPGAGTYDDNDSTISWVYVGNWLPFNGVGPYNNTLHYTNAVGNWAWFTFTGTQFTLSYTQNTNRGSFEIYVDGTKIATINANGTLQWQKLYTSPTFTAGTHIVQFKNIGGSGKITDVDAVQVN